MATPKFAQGSSAAVPINFREFDGGPFTDPADARFDVLDPSDVEVDSDVPTTIVTSPGRHRGDWPIPLGSTLGVWTMRFQATINGSAVQEDCPFEVVAAGSIEPPLTPGPGGLCEVWDIDLDCMDLPDDVEQTVIDRWQSVASNILFTASGRRYGLCEITARPCLRRCGGGYGLFMPYKDGEGAWRNYASCGCHDTCSCVELCEVVLPGPVASVTQVLIDEEYGGDPTTRVLEDTNYRLDLVGGEYRLLRTDGACWPSCSDFTAACEDVGAFCVTYMQGIALDDLAIAAVSQLAGELIKACIPGCACMLPKNAASLTRRGVTVTFDTARPWLRVLPLVAAFLDATNPHDLISGSTVWSPDLPATRLTP